MEETYDLSQRIVGIIGTVIVESIRVRFEAKVRGKIFCLKPQTSNLKQFSEDNKWCKRKTRGDKGSALVIGAGIAGMQSALLLAEMGTKVFLLEQGPAIGGYFPLLDKTFPTNSCGVCFMSPTPPAFCPIYECHLHDNIELLPYSEVVELREREEILRSLFFENPDSSIRNVVPFARPVSRFARWRWRESLVAVWRSERRSTFPIPRRSPTAS